MPLTLNEVQQAAKLARLGISDGEAQQTLASLNNIFTMISEIQAVNTTGIIPMAHAQDVAQRLRDDVAVAHDWREACQAIAPETEAGLYLVPQVIE